MFRRAFAYLVASGLLVGGLAASCSDDVTPMPLATSATSGSGGGTGGAGGMPCVGIEPPAEAYDALPGPRWDVGAGGSGGSGGAGGAVAVGGMGGAVGAGGAGGTLGPHDVGSDVPLYQLEDVQPTSCGYEAVYGLDQFRGQVTVAALLAGW